MTTFLLPCGFDLRGVWIVIWVGAASYFCSCACAAATPPELDGLLLPVLELEAAALLALGELLDELLPQAATASPSASVPMAASALIRPLCRRRGPVWCVIFLLL